jgi:hypothetical protein
MTLAVDIERVAAEADFGQPSARKGGRDPRWPYVPIVKLTTYGLNAAETSQVRGLAYATREEAVAAAARHIAAQRADLAAKLVEPRHRALRESYGLPREIPTPEEES